MFAVGEDFVLVGQVGAAGVDEIEAGQAVLGGDLLGAEMLLDRHRVVGAAFHRRVVAHDHDLASLDAADAGDDAGAGAGAVIHVVGCKRTNLEERGAGVDQVLNAVTGQHLAAGEMAFARLRAAAFHGCGGGLANFLERILHRGRAGFEIGAAR